MQNKIIGQSDLKHTAMTDIKASSVDVQKALLVGVNEDTGNVEITSDVDGAAVDMSFDEETGVTTITEVFEDGTTGDVVELTVTPATVDEE